MTTPKLGWNVTVSTGAVIAAVLFLHFGIYASTHWGESPEPGIFSHTGPMWGMLLVATPVCVGFFATAAPISQSAFVAALTILISKKLDFDPDTLAGGPLPLPEYIRAYFRGMFQDFLVIIPAASLLAYFGVLLRRRSEIRRARKLSKAPNRTPDAPSE